MCQEYDELLYENPEVDAVVKVSPAWPGLWP